MQALANTLPAAKSSGLKTAAFMTNLYELVKVLNEEIDDENEELIPHIVLRLLDSGMVKFIGNGRHVSTSFC